MNPYDISTLGANPTTYQSPFGIQPHTFGQPGYGSQFGQQQGYQQNYPGQFSRFGGNVGSEQQSLFQNPLTQSFGQQGEYGSFGQGSPINPSSFVGSISQGPQGRGTNLQALVDPIFLTELSRSARGLQDVADQLDTKDQESQRRGYLAATAHLFYVFGVLSSHGIFIPSELPTRTRTETAGAGNALREFGRVLERLVDKYANGRGVLEELNAVVERGKTCYTEIIRVIEGSGTTTEAGDQSRKKAA